MSEGTQVVADSVRQMLIICGATANHTWSHHGAITCPAALLWQDALQIGTAQYQPEFNHSC